MDFDMSMCDAGLRPQIIRFGTQGKKEHHKLYVDLLQFLNFVSGQSETELISRLKRSKILKFEQQRPTLKLTHFILLEF